MSRLVVWGTGTFARRFIRVVNALGGDIIIAVTSGDDHHENFFESAKWLPPNQLDTVDFDLLVVASSFWSDICRYIHTDHPLLLQRCAVAIEDHHLRAVCSELDQQNGAFDMAFVEELLDQRMPPSAWSGQLYEPVRLRVNDDSRVVAGDHESKLRAVLFYPYFVCTNGERQAEIDLCLRRNLSNPFFSSIVICLDGKEPLPSSINLDKRVEVLPNCGRMTYSLWTQLARERSGCSDIAVLCNSDVFFEPSQTSHIYSVFEGGDVPVFAAFSRWEHWGGTSMFHARPHYSQDAWAVRVADLTNTSDFIRLEVELGRPRCDNKVAFLFDSLGFDVVNPSLDVCVQHVHVTGIRSYDMTTSMENLGFLMFPHPTNARGEGTVSELAYANAPADQYRSVRFVYPRGTLA
jgi:hypothetical protein